MSRRTTSTSCSASSRSASSPAGGGQDGAAPRAQDRVEEPEVLRLVVDREDREVRVHPGCLPGQQPGHLGGQGAHLQRLLEVAVEPVPLRPRVVGGHRERRDGDDRHRRERPRRGSGAGPPTRRCRAAGGPSAPGRGAPRRRGGRRPPRWWPRRRGSPACCSTSRTSLRLSGLSSTTRIVGAVAPVTGPPRRARPPAGRRAQRDAGGPQGGQQALAADRLGEVRRRAEGPARATARRRSRRPRPGCPRSSGSALEVREHLPPVELGQPDVEDDRGGHAAAGPGRAPRRRRGHRTMSTPDPSR